MKVKNLLPALAMTALLFSGAGLANAEEDREITTEDVIKAQEAWGDAIVAIGEAYTSHGDYKALAEETVDDLYGYDEGIVLFKPTKASEEPFRLSEDEAVSYFVTGIVPEDHGFAIQPWSHVRFDNAGIIIDEDSALAMGHYYFTDANTGEETEAEYTLGYFKDEDGNLRIDLHHSSFPFHPAS
ncbi:phosphoribosyl-AMP cyclohydrolase [Litchfieldella qijiaojingensis]|uniref:Phosphoribosyl-AMP cyclohydrolase n=2 Tax=Litchfieldella qijiaojingensis TaxID=980347 RepID=A0ABQ2Z831_9GAMM|nr:phosphoribosyl-AMP cyclohydrolase [Halomonas qijiaojingensis]